jgi:hypothetical protein
MLPITCTCGTVLDEKSLMGTTTLVCGTCGASRSLKAEPPTSRREDPLADSPLDLARECWRDRLKLALWFMGLSAIVGMVLTFFAVRMSPDDGVTLLKFTAGLAGTGIAILIIRASTAYQEYDSLRKKPGTDPCSGISAGDGGGAEPRRLCKTLAE